MGRGPVPSAVIVRLLPLLPLPGRWPNSTLRAAFPRPGSGDLRSQSCSLHARPRRRGRLAAGASVRVCVGVCVCGSPWESSCGGCPAPGVGGFSAWPPRCTGFGAGPRQGQCSARSCRCWEEPVDEAARWAQRGRGPAWVPPPPGSTRLGAGRPGVRFQACDRPAPAEGPGTSPLAPLGSDTYL